MPKATVAAVLLQGAGPAAKVLLTRRNVEPFKGRWCLPGGYIEDYELVTAAVVREVKEETGLDFTPRFLGFFDEAFPGIGIHNVVLVFEGEASGALVASPQEVKEAGWFDLADARVFDLAFAHNRVLEEFARRRR